MITSKFVPVTEKQAAEWSGEHPGIKKYQTAMRAHFDVNNSRREMRTFGIAFLLYVVGGLLAVYLPILAAIGAVGLLGWTVRHVVTFFKAKSVARSADDEYIRGIKEVPQPPPDSKEAQPA